MQTMLRSEGEITEDGRLIVDLPPEAPHGRVVVTVEPLSGDDLQLSDEDPDGRGAHRGRIALSPEIGAWAEDGTMQSGAEYVENLRRTPLGTHGD